MTRICHLIDDTSPGGVMRMLDFIQGSSKMLTLGTHDTIRTSAGLARAPKLTANIIVSHVVLSWRNLPFFLSLRARNRHATIIHIEHHYSASFEAIDVKSPARFRAMLRLSMSVFDHVVTISAAQHAWLCESVGIAADALQMIPSCVALDDFLAIDPPNRKIRRIGAIGRQHAQKGLDVLIPAFQAAALENVTLDIFGDGP